MASNSWLRSLKALLPDAWAVRGGAKAVRRKPTRRRPTLETLEDRAVPATVLTFDDISSAINVPVPTGYGGFDWRSSNSSYFSDPDLWYGGYGSAGIGGSKAAWTAYGGQYSFVTWLGSDTVNVQGAYFANDSAAPNLRISGYNNGTLIAQRDIYGLGSGPTWVQLDFNGIDQLVIDSGLSGPPSRWWSMDNFTFTLGTPPVTTASFSGTPGTNGWYKSQVTVNLSATDDGSVAATYYRVDGGAQQTYGGPFTLSANGAHTVNYWSVDNAGNVESTKSQTVQIDTVAPVISTQRAPTANAFGWNNTDVVASYSASDATSGLPAGTSTGSFTFTAEGSNQSHSFTVTDQAGNAATVTVAGVNIDKTAAATTASLSGTQGSNDWYTSPVTVSLSATDSLSGVANTFYRIGSVGSFSVYNPASKPVVSNDGPTTVYYFSTDRAGNSEGVRSVSFQIDRTAPAVSMTGPAVGSLTNNRTPTLTATASDGPSGVASVLFQISGNGGGTWTNVGTADLTAPYSAQVSSALADGTYLARAVATDVAGNSTTSAAVSFTVDATAPSITGVSDVPDPFSPNADGVKDTTTISYTVSEASTVTLTLADSANQLVKTLVNAAAQGPGSFTANWDGKNTQGQVVADGTYTYNIRATDAAGNVTNSATLSGTDHTVTVDSTAPTVAITSRPADPTKLDSAGFNFAGTDNLTSSANLTYKYSLNGGTYWTIPSNGTTLSLSGLADGRYTLSVRSVDEAGNVSAANSYDWTVDTTAPTTAASVSGTQGGAGWYTSPATVTLTADDANGSEAVSGVATTYYTVDGGSRQTYTGAFPLSADGQHTVSYWSVDNAGNEETPHQTLNVNIDQTAPSISGAPTTAANADGWYNGPVTVHFDASDPAPGSGLASVTGDVTLSGEGNGQSVTGTAADAAGNSASTTVGGINIDVTAPTTTATRSVAPNANGWNNADVTLTLAATDNLSGVKATYCKIDGGATQTGTSLTLSEGVHTVEFWSVDRADNEETHQTVTVRIDETDPTISAGRDLGSEANAYGWNNGSVAANYSAGDDLSGLPAGTETGGFIFTIEGAGQSHTFTVTDRAGNSASATVSDVNLDLTKPAISASATTADGVAYTSGVWTNQDVTVHFTTGDALSGIASSPADVTASGEGAGQSVSGTAIDRAGNSESATFGDIRIDKTAPVTTADEHGYQGEWVNHAVTITLDAADQGGLSGVSGTFYTIDGGAAQVYDGNTGIVVSDPGVNTVTYSSLDVAGNLEASQTLTVRIDDTAPVTTASSDGQTYADQHAGWNNTNVSVTLSPSDVGGSGLDRTEYSTDGGSTWTSYTAPFTLSQEGTYTVLYRSVDNAGNVEDVSAGHTLTIKIDKTAPVISASRTGQGYADVHAGWNNSDVTVSFTASDALSGGVISPADHVFGEGFNQTASATVTDLAGNSAAASISGINVDKTAPVISAAITSPDTGTGWYNIASGPAVVSYTTSDGGGSGLAQANPANTTFGDGADQSLAAVTVFDVAGNSATSESFAGINQDTVAPALSQSINNPDATTGWYNLGTGRAVVHYTAFDETSGVGAPADVTVADGGDQSVAAATVTDVAGNTSAATAGYNHLRVDTVAPVLSAAINDPAATGWYNLATGPAVVTYAATDATSGVAAPAAHTFGEGADQQLAAVTVADAAGNVSNEAGAFDHVNVDLTRPTVTAAATTPPNGNGWYKQDVVVHFSSADGLSGLAGTPADQVLSAEGAAVSSTPVSVTDVAGNVSDPSNVVTVKLDKTAPHTGIALDGTAGQNGWYTSTVSVSLSADDALSGVAGTEYRVDGGGWTAYTTAFTLSDGVHQVEYRSTDVADNLESIEVQLVKIDTVAPVVVLTPARPADHNGWYNHAVGFSVAATDVGGSGVVGQDPDFTYAGPDSATATVSASATDEAGNVGTASYDFRYDATAPTISGAPDRQANAAGWYNAAVTVSFTVADNLSGVAGVTDPVTLHEGADQSVTGVVTDQAGNTASTTVSGINIDETAPTISGAATTAPNAAGWYNGDVTVRWTAGDALSGIASAPADATITGEGNNLSAAAAVSDRAGNSASATVAGIKIDRTAAVTTASAAGATKNASGWYTGPVTVTLAAADQAGLSGVAGTYYTVDGGAAQTYSGPFVLTADGTHAVTFWSVDHAGNVEQVKTLTVAIDKAAPTTGLAATGTSLPGTSFSWGSADPTSGVAGTVVKVDGQVVSSAPSGSLARLPGTHVVSVTTTDVAGNVTTDTQTYTVTGVAVVNGNLVIVTGDADDTIVVTAADATHVSARVNGGPVVNYVLGPGGHVIAYGLGGNDTVTVDGHVNAEVHGGAGNDVITGGAGNDVIWGDAGDDVVTGSAGNDVLVGGTGSDRLVGSAGHDLLISGEPFGALNAGGYDYDALRAIDDAWAAQWTPDTTLGSAGEVVGEAGSADKLTGSSGHDWFILRLTDTITDINSAGKDGDRISWL